MMADKKPQHRNKEESEQLRGERDKIKFIHLRFERWQVVGLRKARRLQVFLVGLVAKCLLSLESAYESL